MIHIPTFRRSVNSTPGTHAHKHCAYTSSKYLVPTMTGSETSRSLPGKLSDGIKQNNNTLKTCVSTLDRAFIFPVSGIDAALKEGLSGTTVTFDINSRARAFSFVPPKVSRILVKLSAADVHVYSFFPGERETE